MATKTRDADTSLANRRAPSVTTQVVFVKTSDLAFDPENPRFYRLNNPNSVPDVLEEMLDQEGVQDLMLSIGQKGYFAGEPLLVVSTTGLAPFTVVEGNRRLAATKLLSGELQPAARRKSSVSLIRAEANVKQFPAGLPCLIYKSRRDVLRYLGYRHITGIKEWDSLSKARYLAELRDEFYAGKAHVEQMKSLANDIGSRSDYVAQLLTALGLYIKADSTKFFGLPIRSEDVEFSYLTTALNYTNICTWLGLEGKTDIQMQNLNVDNLKKAFGWFYSKDELGRTVLGETRNLAELSSIVRSKSAVKVLEQTKRIDEAFLHTDGPQQALENAMQQAHDRIMVVWRMVPNTAPISAAHLELANRIAQDARQIRNTVADKVEDASHVR